VLKPGGHVLINVAALGSAGAHSAVAMECGATGDACSAGLGAGFGSNG
jgi:hypothetical protein